MINLITSINRKLSPELRKIISGIGWQTVEKFLGLMLNFFIGIYIIRYLGAYDFGTLSYALSVVSLFRSFAKLGLDAVVVRNIVKERGLTQEIIGTAFGIKIITGFISFLLIFLITVIAYKEQQLQWIIVIIATGIFLDSLEVVDFWFQSQVIYRPLVTVRCTRLFISSIIKLCLIKFKSPLIGFVYLIFAEQVLQTFGYLYMYVRNKQSLTSWRFKQVIAFSMIRDSSLLVLSAIMHIIYLRIDQVMLGNMIGSREVGIYAAAVKFSEVWYFVPTIVCSSVFPAIISARQRDKKEYYQKFQQLYDFMSWLGIIIAVIVTLLAKPLIINLLGDEYVESANILTLHIWAAVFIFLIQGRARWLIAENLPFLNFTTELSGAISNVILNLWLIPSFGAVGAAIATLVSYGITLNLASLVHPRMYPVNYMMIKALVIPFRIRQNLIYLRHIKKAFGSI